MLVFGGVRMEKGDRMRCEREQPAGIPEFGPRPGAQLQAASVSFKLIRRPSLYISLW